MSNVQPYPLDVEGLRKGQVLSIEELEQILGMPRDDRRWQYSLLKLTKKICALRFRLDLPELTMRIEKGKLVICDDEDAALTNSRRSHGRIRGYKRDFRRNLVVDATKLSDETKKIHERDLARGALMIAAIRGVRRKLLTGEGLNGNGRKTPLMVQGAAEPAGCTSNE